MFDIAPMEMLVCAIVALVVIGPKDLPKALRVVGQWVAKIRGYARHFRSGVDAMIRESELADLEKQWAEQNAKIMADYPVVDSVAGGDADVAPAASTPMYAPADAADGATAMTPLSEGSGAIAPKKPRKPRAPKPSKAASGKSS